MIIDELENRLEVQLQKHFKYGAGRNDLLKDFDDIVEQYWSLHFVFVNLGKANVFNATTPTE